MVVELTDDPSGKYLQILDDNNSADGPHDTYGLLTREDPLPWPNEIGFQFDLALLAGNWIRLWTYAASGAIDFWQVVVEIKDGEVRGWDHVLYDWVFCAPAVVGEWYTFEIYFNHDTDRYSVMIDGAPSLCGDLRVLSVVPDLDEGLTVATLGDAGATGTLAFDNLRVFIPGGRRLNQ
ncbi:MAG: hypothetical protein M5R36_24360 [Deltaproteobacteria bacterium]|nr:hypothetical protein [Deltaproteobacteria bacterium]